MENRMGRCFDKVKAVDGKDGLFFSRITFLLTAETILGDRIPTGVRVVGHGMVFLLEDA
jgi:hypothetical protein